MDNIIKSFATLVKYNNGFFKSEKQANFLLKMVGDGKNIGTRKAYNNSVLVQYICDSEGVVRVEKIKQNGAIVIEWERIESGLTFDQQKRIKYLKTRIKELDKDIESRKGVDFKEHPASEYMDKVDRDQRDRLTTELTSLEHKN